MNRILFSSLWFLISSTFLHADTNAAVSDVFSFDVRDTTGTTESESGVFWMDVRDLGNSASSSSGVFALGTTGENLDTLVIDAGAPGSVVAGEAYAFPVMASFEGSGGLVDVSEHASWFIVGDAPAGTVFEGNKLIAGSVDEETVILVSAVFVFPSGAREAVPVEVTVLPATPDYQVEVVYSSSDPLWLSNQFYYTLTCNAATSGPAGETDPENVSWDFDDDGTFGDATGLQVERTFPAGTTVRVGVRAEWSLGVGPPATASKYFYVTFEQPYADNEPPRGRAMDVLNGSFWDSSGGLFTPSETNKENGLVVLTHGLWGAGDNGWLQSMREAVLERMSDGVPNVAIYDWEKMSDPTEYRTNGTTEGQEQSGVLQIDDFVAIRPHGKAQGVMIADWIDRQRMLGRVDRSAKVHLIGHSAGGFAMGEAARLLSQRLYSQVQVTMLDTPLPYQSHLDDAWRSERYISSFLGGNPSTEFEVNAWNAASLLIGSKVDRFAYKRPLWSGLLGTGGVFVSGEVEWIAKVPTGPSYYRTVIDPRCDDLFEQHGAAHEYYLSTITASEQESGAWAGEVLGDGFNQSLLVDDSDFEPSPQAAGSSLRFVPQEAEADVPAMEDFTTFGQVVRTGSVYQVSEEANAGIFKESYELPQWASTLEFDLQITTSGDGDFVSVHWNDGDALAIIPETSLAYDAPLSHEVDLTGLGGQTGTLTLKLNSRGSANSVVEFSEIRILEDGDLDGDGLENELELTAGSDPLLIDSDGDSLTDGEEVLTYGTSPAMGDTDGDGQGDSGEIAAGTDPLSGASRFVAAMGAVTPGASASIHWNGAEGRSYRVMRSQELGTLNVDFLDAGLDGVDGDMEFEDADAPPDRAFYWIEVE